MPDLFFKVFPDSLEDELSVFDFQIDQLLITRIWV
jgi:hypothetical protein